MNIKNPFCFFVLFFLFTQACATTENAYTKVAANEYEFWSLTTENISAGSFHVCKDNHNTGFKINDTKSGRGKLIIARIECVGPIDKLNIEKYSKTSIKSENYDKSWMRYKVQTDAAN